MRSIINTSKAPAPIGSYNQAVLVKETLYISGQIAIDPETNELKTSSLEEETALVMRNLSAILNEADMTFENVVKSSIFISNMKNFAIINKIYSKCFREENAPARETVEVANLPKYVNVEISMIAVR
ncbi:Rid family detoxifying hydrolase [Haloflavibacter putidus]|uniref:RidA family protein n=1 Tax=Haloflavibacter putidus TaxID=2576776 RepID=A0A508A2Z8_9FLAO|nr:Rid family detoxifying hydrolase [Haloflavibacter putidus]TQD40212.1 RidA family protein [Haloflavibacter putidus]